MKIIFDHINGFGKISNQDFIHTSVTGYPEISDDFDELLELGWLPWNNYWFQARSVRYNLSKIKFHKKTIKTAKKIEYQIGKPSKEDILRISKSYQNKKTFSSDHVFDNELMLENTIQYFYESNLIGFVCYKLFKKSFIGVQFAWDYEKPSLSLGNISTYIETTLAKRSGCIYYYMMGGYEDCSIYKSELEGFEWWTGKEWSVDKKEYEYLCKRDSLIEIKNVNYNI
jgi:hypothetical protein